MAPVYEPVASIPRAICPICRQERSSWDFVMSMSVGGTTLVEPTMGGLKYVDEPSFFGCGACYSESDAALSEAQLRVERALQELLDVEQALLETRIRVDARRAREAA